MTATVPPKLSTLVAVETQSSFQQAIRQMKSGEGGNSLPAAWQVWERLTQAGLPPTPPQNHACAQEGLWAFLALARGEGAVLKLGSLYCNCGRGCVAGSQLGHSPE